MSDPVLVTSTVIWAISGRNRFETTAPTLPPFATKNQVEACLRWADQYFLRPVCRVCHQPTSARNENSLDVDVAERDAAAFGEIGRFGGTMSHMFSDEFLGFLGERERSGLELRAVHVRAARSSMFWELVGPRGVPRVAAANWPPRGWRCSDCGFRTWGYWENSSSTHQVISSADLPGDGEVFVLGEPPAVSIALSESKWLQLQVKLTEIGIDASPVAVLASDQIERDPKLPTLQEAQRRGWRG